MSENDAWPMPVGSMKPKEALILFPLSALRFQFEPPYVGCYEEKEALRLCAFAFNSEPCAF